MALIAGSLGCLVSLFLVIYALRFLVGWVGSYPVLGIIVTVVLLMVYGVIGNKLGLAHHFLPAVAIPGGTHPGLWLGVGPATEERTQFFSGLAVMGLFTLVAVLVHLLDRTGSPQADALSTKRDRLVGPLRVIRDLARWILCLFGRLRNPAGYLGAVPAAPTSPAQVRQLVSQLIFRPCCLLAVLAAGVAFAEVSGTRITRLDRAALLQATEDVSWWWLIGLASGTLLAWIVAWSAAWLFGQANPAGSRLAIRAILGLIMAGFFGVALRFRSAGDLVVIDNELNRTQQQGWITLDLIMLGIAVLLSLAVWVSRRLRRPPDPTSLLTLLAWRFGISQLCFVVVWLGFLLARTDRPLIVSATLCTLLGLSATAYAAFLTVSVTRRLAFTVVLFAILFAASGTNWNGPRSGPADDYKLQFDSLYRQGLRRASYYDYPVLLDSKSYLDRSYLHPISIAHASNTDPIVITSVQAHQLRTGDRVRISDVRGNAAANGTFSVIVSEAHLPNEFALAGSSGTGTYTFGGEWIEDLDQGRILDARADAVPGAKRLLLTAYDHGLRDGQTIRLVDAAGEPIPSTDARPLVVRSRAADDARVGAQFLLEGVDPKADLLTRLINGRWLPDPPVLQRGGVAWVTRSTSSWFDRAPQIVVSAFDPNPRSKTPTRDHGLKTGQRVLIEGVVANPEANGVWTIFVIDKQQFALLDPNRGECRKDETAFRSAAGSDQMSGGSWQVVDDRGRISFASNQPGRPIRIRSIGHGLRDGDHVEITGVDGNTQANGIWTVRLVHHDEDPALREEERREIARLVPSMGNRAADDAIIKALTPATFELVGPAADAWPGHPTRRQPHMADGQPSFDYRGGGEWLKIPYRGRIFAIKAEDSGEAWVHSPNHRLKPGTTIELGGIAFDSGGAKAGDPSKLEAAFNGQLFRVADRKDDWFALDPAPDFPPNSSRAVRGAVAEWSIVYDRGPTLAVSKDAGGNLHIYSPGHGLQPNNRVRLAGTPWSEVNANGVYAVAESWCEDCFTLQDFKSAAVPRIDERTGVTGLWQRVTDTGTFTIRPPFASRLRDGGVVTRFLDRSNQPIELTSPSHGLKPGDRVTIDGPNWAKALQHAATFTVAAAKNLPESGFLLAGTGAFRVAGTADKPSTTAPSTWRRLDRLGRPGHMLVAESITYDERHATHPLVVTSSGHDLEDHDRVRLERIGLKDGVVAAGERFADTFAIKKVDANSFRIPLYESWEKPVHEGEQGRQECLSSIALIKQQSVVQPSVSGRALICAWRPITDRGVVAGAEVKGLAFRVRNSDRPVAQANVRRKPRRPGSKEDRVLPAIYETVVDGRPVEVTPRANVWIDSPRHGLAAGAWVFITRHDSLRGGPFKVVETAEDAFCVDAYGGLLKPGRIQPDPMARWTVAGLLDDQEVLANWSDTLHELWYTREEQKRKQSLAQPQAAEREGGPPGALGPAPKPKLAIVTVSGGGIRSAVWTASVLQRLDSELTDFPYHTRLITGASGGMVGAAYYVATLAPPKFPDPDAPMPPKAAKPIYHPDPISDDGSLSLVDHLSRDHLSRVANQLAFSDLPSMFWPKPWGTDRGLALEKTWWWNTNPDPDRGPLASPLARSMRGLAVGEWQGWRPSLIFTPMFVEDGRRLLISNLNLEFAPRNIGHVLFARGTDKLSRSTKRVATGLKSPLGDSDIFSLSAVEFFRIFPEAHNFRLSTAARMSAAFPLITPAVSIPTIPPRRVVDAGYYDNYGVNLAALWVFQNRERLFEYTSGVVLIQIRDSQSEHGRRELADSGSKPAGGPLSNLLNLSPVSGHALNLLGDLGAKAARGSQWLTSPLEGLSAARQANMSFRNDEQVEAISNIINPIRDKGFFTTVVFECPKEASLSWALSSRERADIENGLDPDLIDPTYSEGARRNVERLRMLVRWWYR